MPTNLTREEVLTWFSNEKSYPHFLTIEDRRNIMQLFDRIEDLEEGIKKHRDERGDDRCWIDDRKLYELVGGAANTALPPLETMMDNCHRFWASRQNPEHKYETVAEQLDPLKRENILLRNRIKNQEEEAKKDFLYDLEQTLRPTNAALPEDWEWRKKIREVVRKNLDL